MKKILYSVIAAIGIFGATSCSDMLESDSTRQVSDPDLNSKTDSIFYAYGIMQGMQQLADQYFFQNEMRGELVAPTTKATTHLQNLSNFSAGAENKYDSVYLYYKVINNCNYYLLKRDTTLVTGTRNVTYNEYANVAAFRAWAYLQLTTQYGDVPYITDPVTTISQINASTATTNYKQILTQQAEYMQSLKNKMTPEQLDAPVYSGRGVNVAMGHINSSNSINKYYKPYMCFVPFNVVLGDLYLETGEYEKAAQCYYDYLKYQSETYGVTSIANRWSNQRYSYDDDTVNEWPLDYNSNENNKLNNSVAGWSIGFSSFPSNEALSYIPMAVNYTSGQTTNVPLAFGYDYYATSDKRVATLRLYACPETENVQVVPSAEYNDMAFNAPYYYYTQTKDPSVSTTRYLFSSVNKGDGRANMVCKGREDYKDLVFVNKPSSGYITLYRTSTVYMHLAEALNRLGEPELAFTILKTGLHDGIKAYVDTAYVATNMIPEENYYIPKASYDRLKTGSFPFLGEGSKTFFTNSANKEIVGIHFHGAGAVEDVRSPYTYKAIVEEKIEAIRSKFGVGSGAYTKEEYINAVEDLLCDEYAMEFAFEGRRFSDLLRIARHKNESSPYGSSYGDTWLSKKLESKKAGITTQNCYLPFK